MVTKPIFTKLRAHVKESLPLEKAVGLPERLLVKFTGAVLRTLKKPERDTFLAEGGLPELPLEEWFDLYPEVGLFSLEPSPPSCCCEIRTPL